ncbi:hypothetical protein BpHYR1_007897 [Brachionus plicatilis]|uniref:Uncharacterized protein n=1 Tax=Brachionus plicatilis TaxID=10195 RepID=A0A3M7QIR1_BRAPC|nr:hypothetical protein BpHYR1_007897 [Brachionus plicatilis]
MLKLQKNSDIWQIYCIRQPKRLLNNSGLIVGIWCIESKKKQSKNRSPYSPPPPITQVQQSNDLNIFNQMMLFNI